ncbi:FAD-binding monooxygenase [bacterium SCGC AG-212-C10]|nr:FAD-binding monooxygenase [bacterium SCGC AG-212-C10]
MTARTGHAVIMGASMAGLTAARAASNHFERVTIVERDRLAEEAENRKGVPQGNHAHGLLATGYRVLDAYYPGLFDEIVANGGKRGDVTGDFLWYQYGNWKLRTNCGLGGCIMSRALLESTVRKYTKALPNVTFADGFDAEHPVYAGGRVTGVTIKSHDTGAIETMDADLVVDATGRGSQSPKWLQEWGFKPAPETQIEVNVGYATAVFERRETDLWGASGAIIAGTVPRATRFAAVIAMEGERWMVTLAGAVKDYPPTDLPGWTDFARGLPTIDVSEMLKGREPIGEILSYRYPANRRRHYEQLETFPEGYVVIGDAVCSFNPVYGQGMSVACMEAKAFDECLAAGRQGLWKPFFARAKKITESPWTIATGEDLKYPQVVGKRPPGFAFVNRYMARAHDACAKDPVVLRQFFNVANLLAPPASMLSPRIAWRVAVGGRGQRQKSPATVR